MTSGPELGSDNVLVQRGAGIRLWMPPDSDVELFDNIINQPNGGFVLATENSAAGVQLRDNRYWSAAPQIPDIWSRCASSRQLAIDFQI